MNNYLPLLQTTTLFAGLSAAELSTLLSRLGAGVRSYGKGEALVLAGEPSRRVYGDYPFIDTEEEAIRFANEARREEVTRYQKDIQQVMKEGYPVFLTGDFNEPSFLDWTQRAADAGIHKIKVEWPATKAFSEIGMNDSYRTIHPDEVSTPGYTWTPVPSEQEILDRLDFVLYSGCKVTDSFITGESETTSDVVVSPYPSDHRMVTSCFNF